ncbi:MAG: formylmethanofuran dehydrogenase subunit C [Longimicrobiales bacterium]
MPRVTLALRARPAVPLEAPCVRPDAFPAMSAAEIGRLTVWHGNEPVPLGDWFDIDGGYGDDVRVTGDALASVKRLGEEMAGGRLVIEGHAGTHAGARMSGGHIRIEGDADDWVGAEMRGGVIDVQGRAGAHAGAAYAGSRRGMSGGALILRGDAGDFLGDIMRRGLIAVGGGTGDYAGAGMIAGSILVFGDAGRRAGAGLKRGSIVAYGDIEPLPTYRYACTYRPPFLPLYLRTLRDRHGMRFDDRFMNGRYRRYTGDLTELARGEILIWTDS